jgi:hypothetical protein
MGEAVNNKAKYEEPPIPEGRIAFTHALIEITKISLDTFLRANDGRKFLVKCRNRQYLLLKLASFADPDGTSCYPSIERLLDETKFSNGTLNSYLKDLESDELGVLVKGGYAWEDGPRVRRLTLPTGKAGLPDSKQDSSIGGPGLQDSKAGLQYSRSRIPVQTGNNLAVFDLPEKHLPPHDQEPGGGFTSNSDANPTGNEIFARSLKTVRDAFQEVMEEAECDHPTLTSKGAKSLFVGRAPEDVEYIVTEFLGSRSWKGLIHPETMFLQEFPNFYSEFMERMAQQEKQQAELAEARRQIEQARINGRKESEKLLADRRQTNLISSNLPAAKADPADQHVIAKVWAGRNLNESNERIAHLTGLTVAEVTTILDAVQTPKGTSAVNVASTLAATRNSG